MTEYNRRKNAASPAITLSHFRGDASDQAARWYAAMRSDVISSRRRNEFEAWLAANGEHRTAYERIDRQWQATDNLLEAESLQTMGEAFLQEGNGSAPRILRRYSMAAAALLLVAVGVFYFGDVVPKGELYSTVIGEQKIVSLEDGSTVKLNTNTELNVEFTATTRRVALLRGQAWFAVAKNSARPFVVDYGRGRVTVLGTEFDVYRTPGSATITLLDGSVRVDKKANGEKNGAVTLVAYRDATSGQQVRHTDQGLSKIFVAPRDEITGWQENKMIFNNWPLEKALEEVNRYSETQVFIGDDSLKKLRLSGMFHTRQPSVVIRAVKSYFPIKVVEDRRGNMILLPDRSGSGE